MKIGIVADDLTGANATGVLLNKQGFTSATVVQNSESDVSIELDALCIDTDTRYAADEIVVERVTEAVQYFHGWGAEIICKRIDSTVRGKIGLEIDTVLDNIGDDSVAIVVGAFPDSGRIASGGYLLVHGVPVQETDVAKDPVKGIHTSFIPELIKEQSAHSVGYIGLNHVLSGAKQLATSISEQINKKNRIVVIDAVRDEDIDIIADAMALTKEVQLVPVDPGPLSAAYATAYFDQFVEKKKIIITVGSVTSLSRKQLQYVQKKTNTTPVYISAEKLATLSKWREEVERGTKAALESMDEQDVLILTTELDTGNLVNLKKLAEEQQTTENVLAKKITDGLAMITRLVMQQTHHIIQGCFTSGGDVTASLCAVTNAAGIELEEEVFPLAAFGKLMGGEFSGQPIITKGGLIGNEKAIYNCVKYLRTLHVIKE